jgi:hypothetical protein
MERVREVHYLRQFPNLLDRKTGKPLEYEIPKSIALYILDDADKHQRLASSSRERPLASYSGQSRVWPEERAGKEVARGVGR